MGREKRKKINNSMELSNKLKKVVILPGRFQPMLKHHAEVYNQLQQQFPDAEVYFGTSDKVELPKSPFNFQEKRAIAQAHGIPADRVLKAARPYNPSDYDFDPNNTIIIFAVGEKDLARFPFSNLDSETGLDMSKRDANKPNYIQKISTLKRDPRPMSERGYVTLAPTVMLGDKAASASAFRQSLADAPDTEAAKEVFVDQFGSYNDKIFKLIYSKIIGANMKEQINRMRILAGLPIMEAAPVNFAPGYAMTDTDRKLAGIGQLLMQKAETESDPKLSNAIAALGGSLAGGEIKTTEDLMSFITSYKVQGDRDKDMPAPLSSEMKSALSTAASEAIQAYNSGERAAGLKPGETPEGEPEDQEEFEEDADYADDDDENYDHFKNGDLVKFKGQYDDGSGEVFTLSQWDGVTGRGWVLDDRGSGWSVKGFQIEPVDNESDSESEDYTDDDNNDSAWDAEDYNDDVHETIEEKAVSQAQQKAAGAALAAKRGDAPKSELKGASKEMMDMSTKELEKFAGTKHKGLPKKKSEAVEETAGNVVEDSVEFMTMDRLRRLAGLS
jgi:hypothetical protein